MRVKGKPREGYEKVSEGLGKILDGSPKDSCGEHRCQILSVG
jgi:hypothetical protein